MCREAVPTVELVEIFVMKKYTLTAEGLSIVVAAVVVTAASSTPRRGRFKRCEDARNCVLVRARSHSVRALSAV